MVRDELGGGRLLLPCLTGLSVSFMDSTVSVSFMDSTVSVSFINPAVFVSFMDSAVSVPFTFFAELLKTDIATRSLFLPSPLSPSLLLVRIWKEGEGSCSSAPSKLFDSARHSLDSFNLSLSDEDNASLTNLLSNHC